MHCKNCGAPLEDDAGFCSYCGARVIDERISTKFLFQEILDKVLSVDNKLLKTFIHLFTKPEEVINGYISGIRKRYYNPFSYLLISITLTGIYLYFLKDVLVESFTDPNSQNPFENAEYTTSFMDLFTEYQAFFTVLNIPLYGFMSWLVFLNRKKYNFYEHLVIYLYAASQVSVLTFLIVVPFYFVDKNSSAYLSLIMSIFTFVYFAYVLIRLYKLKFWQFIVKGLYFVFVFVVLMFIIGIITNIIMYFSMGQEEYFKQFVPSQYNKQNDSIQRNPDSLKTAPKLDSIKEKSIDSLKFKSKKDSLLNDPKTISYYEASSKLNCFS